MYTRSYRRILIILLLSLIFAIEIGYASFSTDTNSIDYIENGNLFDIRFENAYVVKSVGVNQDTSLITILPGGKKLNVNVSNLQYPGAGVEFSVDIVNYGDTRAKVESIILSGLDDNDDIKVNITNRDMAEDKELNPNESYNLHFTVVWDYNSIKEIKEAKSFNLIINCKQAI